MICLTTTLTSFVLSSGLLWHRAGRGHDDGYNLFFRDFFGAGEDELSILMLKKGMVLLNFEVSILTRLQSRSVLVEDGMENKDVDVMK